MQAERPGGGLVAIKALSLRSMQGDWQQLELFEKEANALRSMSHPGIPAYKDYFEVDNDGDRAYFLVQVCFAQACFSWLWCTIGSKGYRHLDCCGMQTFRASLHASGGPC